jgi:HEAT repeat protein
VGAEAASLVPKIQPLLKDEDATVRRTAAYVLGTIGPAAKAAVPDLKAMLDTQDRNQIDRGGERPPIDRSLLAAWNEGGEHLPRRRWRMKLG